MYEMTFNETTLNDLLAHNTENGGRQIYAAVIAPYSGVFTAVDTSEEVILPKLACPYQVNDIFAIQEQWTQTSAGYVYKIGNAEAQYYHFHPAPSMPLTAARMYGRIVSTRVWVVTPEISNNYLTVGSNLDKYDGVAKIIGSTDRGNQLLRNIRTANNKELLSKTYQPNVIANPDTVELNVRRNRRGDAVTYSYYSSVGNFSSGYIETPVSGHVSFTPHSSTAACHIIIPCKYGDTFMLTGSPFSNAATARSRLWVNSDQTAYDKANSTFNKTVISAPITGYLVLNFDVSTTHIAQKLHVVATTTSPIAAETRKFRMLSGSLYVSHVLGFNDINHGYDPDYPNDPDNPSIANSEYSKYWERWKAVKRPTADAATPGSEHYEANLEYIGEVIPDPDSATSPREYWYYQLDRHGNRIPDWATYTTQVIDPDLRLYCWLISAYLCDKDGNIYGKWFG